MLAGRDDLRPVPVEALHVTLVFIGTTPPEQAGAVWAASVAAATGATVPKLSPAGITAVPRRRPRLFALDLGDEDGRAARLQRALAQGLATAELHEPEQRAFWAHVTLARVRQGVRACPLGAGAPPIAPFAAEALTLYRSHLSRSGARYEALERLALRS